MRTSAGDSLRPLARPRLYEQVVGRLREYVRSGGLHAGDRLPAERELADRLGVSRTSVRQAIVALEVQGLIEVRHGDGTYLLRDRLEAEPLQAMIERKRLLPHVLDARDAVETKLAELAAARRQEPDLRALDEAIAAMRVAVTAGEERPRIIAIDTNDDLIDLVIVAGVEAAQYAAVVNRVEYRSGRESSSGRVGDDSDLFGRPAAADFAAEIKARPAAGGAV